ncbi:MAG: ArsR/SmtB family transcription factor [Deinococcales bacterium]
MAPVQLELRIEALLLAFKALSDPARIKIVSHLAAQSSCCIGVCACDLETLVGLSQPTVSHHMKCLQSANLVSAEKRGKWIYYTLKPDVFEEVRQFLRCC